MEKHSSQKKTPYVRFGLVPVEWPEAIPESERGTQADDGVFHPTDLSKKSLRLDFYFTDDSKYRLDEFLSSLGVDMAGRSYKECIEEAIGKYVLATVVQRMNETTGESFAEVKAAVGSP